MGDDDRKIHRRFFDSPSEFFAKSGAGVTLDSDVANKYPQTANQMFVTDKGDRFHGCAKKIDKEWKAHKFSAGASLLDGIIGSLKSASFTEDRWQFRRRLEEGDEVDCDRWLAGSDRCWSGVRRRRIEKRVVRLFMQVGGSCRRSAEELAVNGAVAVSVVEMLEASGVAVELWATGLFQDTYRNGDDGLIAVQLKGSQGFSDLGMINFVCGDNHVFRNTFFRAICLLGTEVGADTCSNMGWQVNLTRKHIGLEDCEAEETVVIPSIYDKDKAREWLAEFVKNGGKANEN